jgi:1,2-phenylacetyl-CoA epoxidase catalytic subunit
MSAIHASDAGTATMVGLIGSLADNKCALGRRYGEWAVSAPTIESAVAAAAMAQDELGHARSTYPVLAKLGVTREEDTLYSGFPLAVIDGILTTFVASAPQSSIEPLAQRARKILQEEGAHRRHAEAWTRRILDAGGADRELLLARIGEMWADAARWPGPDDDAGFGEAVRRGMVSEGPAAVRDRVRRWLTALLREHGVEMTLNEPSDWAGWDPEHRR